VLKSLSLFNKLAFLTVFLVSVSCNSLSTIIKPGQEPPISSEEPIQPATPVAMQPAAGICAEGQGEIVIMRVNPDVPDPRCLQVQSDQRLAVFNGLDESLDVSLGELSATIEPGDEHTFDRPLGQILLPGVHALGTSLCCGGEIWLQGDVFEDEIGGTESGTIAETALPETQGHLEFPYISADAGNFILQAGEEIVITWEGTPVGASLYEIRFIHSDTVEENLIMVSSHPAEGVAAEWLVPERVSGRLEGVAIYGDGREVRSGCCSQVFTGDLPPAGICSLLVHGIGVQNLYQEPKEESLRIAGIAPGLYLEVLERTINGWYFVKTDNVIDSGTSETVNTTGWINGQENVGLHGPCEGIPIREY
jgi:hypothetical protein